MARTRGAHETNQHGCAAAVSLFDSALTGTGISVEISPARATGKDGGEIKFESSRGTQTVTISRDGGTAVGELGVLRRSEKLGNAWAALTRQFATGQDFDYAFNTLCDEGRITWSVTPIAPKVLPSGFAPEMPLPSLGARSEEAFGAFAVLKGDRQHGIVLGNGWHLSEGKSSGPLIHYLALSGPSKEFLVFALPGALQPRDAENIAGALASRGAEHSAQLGVLLTEYPIFRAATICIGPQMDSLPADRVVRLHPWSSVHNVEISTSSEIHLKIAPQIDLQFLDVSRGHARFDFDPACAKEDSYGTTLLGFRLRAGAKATFTRGGSSEGNPWAGIDCADFNVYGEISPGLPPEDGFAARLMGKIKLMR